MHNYVVSDIHGNAERLSALLRVLKQKHPKNDFMLTIIGDLLDRGDESAEIISLLSNNYKNITVLKGNHEDLFMQFMENPEENYLYWQMNYAYPTIMSFAQVQANTYAPKYEKKSVNVLKNDVERLYDKVEKKLSKNFGAFSGKHNPYVYIEQMMQTYSQRDRRVISKTINELANEMFKSKGYAFVSAFEQLLYLGMLEDFCDLYDCFASLPSYTVVDDKFLLVHSGYVSKNKNPKLKDSVADYLYNECETIEQLETQNEYPMIWSRRKSLKDGKFVAPQERFDGKIVVLGHTTTDSFNKNSSFETTFTYGEDGLLASIALDGLNWHKTLGRLNCVCLDDLSQIIVKGTGIASLNKPLTVEFIDSVSLQKE